VKNQTFYRVCDGTEGASFSWTLSTVRKFVAVCLCYRGVDNVTPLDATATVATTFTAPSITTVTANTAVLSVYGARSTIGQIGGTWTPAGLDEPARRQRPELHQH